MILESEDYQEPCCPFEKPAPGIRQRGNCKRIDLAAVIGECDRLFNSNDPQALGEHLRYWRKQAAQAGDLESELSILNELMGHYRMQGDRERGLSAVDDGIKLIKFLNILGTVSCGTILINAATALLSFGENDRAQRYYSEAARCYSDNLDPADARFAGLFNNMAAAHMAQGELRHAEAYYRKALQILQENNNLMDSAVTLVNLAQLGYQADRGDEYINDLLDQAMKCFDSLQAVRDGYYAHTCSKCAPAFGFFLREDDEKTLMSRAEEFYAGS
jgi:tetratricopeptide (TPR) repeat protein